MSLVETITLRSGRLSVDVLPSRGLDLGAASFDGTRFSWESPIGHIPWQGSFSRSFGGGLVVTCGLRNAGAPSEGQPQHGWYSSLPARDVATTDSTARGRVVDAEVPGPALELVREVTLADEHVQVSDVVRNLGTAAEAAPILYHVNLSWDALEIDAARVVPRDADAAAGDWRAEGPPGPERVYEHVDAPEARVTYRGLQVTVRSSLPRLWQWIEPSYGVLGIEPANCSVLGRAHDRAEGRLPTLAAGESRTTTLEISVAPA